jgi:hypothetical protein
VVVEADVVVLELVVVVVVVVGAEVVVLELVVVVGAGAVVVALDVVVVVVGAGAVVVALDVVVVVGAGAVVVALDVVVVVVGAGAVVVALDVVVVVGAGAVVVALDVVVVVGGAGGATVTGVVVVVVAEVVTRFTAGATDSDTLTECFSVPLYAVTANVAPRVDADDEAVRFSLVEAPVRMLDESKLALTPAGRPVVLSTTDCADPLVTAVLTVRLASAPRVTERLAGVTATEKSLRAAAVRPTD